MSVMIGSFQFSRFWRHMPLIWWALISRVSLYSATSIYPEIFQSIGCGLLRAELYLSPASLARRRAGFHVLKTDLLFSPGMREYCVQREIAAGGFAGNDFAVGFVV